MNPTIPIIVGPTATGKTGLVLKIAGRCGPIEVVSADSRQVYRRLDIGTAKPTPDERERVPHHLVDVVNPDEAFSAGRFRTGAEAAIADCSKRCVLPVVVGGTGLYLRALTEGLSPIPHVPDDVRLRLRRELDAEGLDALYERLLSVDLKAASGFGPNDPQRTLRALGVYEATGRPLSAWWELPPAGSRFNFRWLGLRCERQKVRERIRRRTEVMIRVGIEAEVRGIIRDGYSWETNAMKTVGYREWRSRIEGSDSVEAVVDRIITHTAQYAKRQMTWFGALPQIAWLDAESSTIVDDTLAWLKDTAS